MMSDGKMAKKRHAVALMIAASSTKVGIELFIQLGVGSAALTASCVGIVLSLGCPSLISFQILHPRQAKFLAR